MKRMSAVLVSALLIPAFAARAQVPAQPAGTAAQREALAALDFLDGEWRGQAVVYGPEGARTLTQTERVGSLLGGSVRVIEGRGYDAEGQTVFNAMAVISWNERENRYGFHSWANGYSGDYKFERTGDGFRWETPAGPGARIEYVATVRDGTWHEVGSYVAEGQPPRQVIDMRLTRVGDSDWPAGDPVPLR